MQLILKYSLMWHQILAEDISKEKRLQLQEIAKDTADIKGKVYTLGPTRKILDENQKSNLNYLKNTFKKFSSRLAEYTNPEIDVSKQILKKNYC